MNPIVFSLPGQEALAAHLSNALGAEPGILKLRQFPDGETYVRIGSAVWGRTAILVCGLDQPNGKSLPLYLAAATLREHGARQVLLVAPYLAYLRQDKIFQEGEGLTSHHYARWLSSFLDGLVTVDPHLHRIRHLDDIYSIPTRVAAAAPAIAQWLLHNQPKSLLIGPDAESEQWVSRIAREAGCPYLVLTKERLGDRKVALRLPELEQHHDHQPVLIDDIIASAGTMIETVGRLRQAGLPAPTCIGVHPIFAGSAYQDLIQAGAARVLSCNSIAHASNAIDVHGLIAEAVAELLLPTPIVKPASASAAAAVPA